MTQALKGLAATVALLVLASPAIARLEDLTSKDAVAGLKAALEKGSQAAIATLGRTDGFLANPQVKIPLPESLERAERLLRRFGMGRYADELIVGMNRAAEAAVPEARALLVDSIRKMSVQDAKRILGGGETAATDYFRRTTQSQLAQRFLPIVKKQTDRVGLARQYNSLAGHGARIGLIEKDQATIEHYVTDKALDGLYFMIGEQEKSFRRNPVGATSEIVRRVFGAMR